MAEQGMAQPPVIYVTRDDLDRLTGLLEAYAAGAWGRRFDQLEGELARAKVVSRPASPGRCNHELPRPFRG